MSMRSSRILVGLLLLVLGSCEEGSGPACGPDHPSGWCPAGQDCQFWTCVRLVGEANVPGLRGDLGARGDRVVIPGSTDRFAITIEQGAACNSLPTADVDNVGLGFNITAPVGTDLTLDSPYWLWGSVRLAEWGSNETATALTLRLTRMDTTAPGRIAGTFHAVFPSLELSGDFDAEICPSP